MHFQQARAVSVPLVMCLALLAPLGALGAEEGPARLPVPDAAQLKKSLDLVKELFGGQYEQAKTDQQKAALARKLLKQAAETSGNPADRFALLRVAGDIAALAGDTQIALECVDRMTAAYEMDGLERKVETLEKTAPSVRLPQKASELAERLDALIEEAVAADRLRLAGRLSKLMSAAALRTRDASIRKKASSRKEQLDRLAEQRAAYEKALAVLEGNPADAAANQAVGAYCCFVRGDWDRGVSHLALGSDTAVREAAVQDLAGPKEPAAQVELGDRWWSLAERKPAAVQRQVLARAVHWYALAQPELAGLRKAKVERRLAEFQKRFGPVAEQPKSAAKEMDLIALVDPEKHAVQGTWQVRNKELSLAVPSSFGRLRFPVIPQGSYELQVEFTRPRGTEGIITMLPVGNSYGMVQLSGWDGQFAGIALLNGAKPNDRRNPTSRPGHLASGVRHKMSIRVKLDNDKQPKEADIHVALDKEKDYLHWSGPQMAVSEDLFWRMPKPGAIGVGTFRDPVVYHSIKLRMLDGEAKVLEDEPCGGPPTEPGSPRSSSPPATAGGKTPLAGGPGQAFEDLAPAGGVLAGVKVSLGKFIGPVLDSIQPVYRVDGKTILGKRYGNSQGQQVEVIAKAGYVVAGANVRAGLRVDALQLVFMRLHGGRLVPTDTYTSEWIGGTGGILQKLGPWPTPVVGIHGTAGRDFRGEKLGGLGLVLKR